MAPSQTVGVSDTLLIFPCTIKSRSSFLAPAYPGDPEKRAIKQLWCGGGGVKELTVPVLKYFLYLSGGWVNVSSGTGSPG